MAAKKKKETKDKAPPFDYETILNTMEIPSMLKAGFRYYVKVNNVEIKSENDLKNLLQKFEVMNAGV